MLSNIFLLIHLLAFIAFIILIVKYFKMRKKGEDLKQIKNKILIAIATWIISFILFGMTTPVDNSEEIEIKDNKAENSVDISKDTKNNDKNKSDGKTSIDSKDKFDKNRNNEKTNELRKMLKEKYDISKPRKFVKGDATSKWRINSVSNSSAPSEYAVDYARAYMIPEGKKDPSVVHYIVNHTLKTTTKFHITLNVLEVITTEYVNGEEHDASSIGNGLLLGERFFDLESGEEIKIETDPTLGTVDHDTFINEVEKVIEDSVGEGEKITGVVFDGNNLEINVNLLNASGSLLDPEVLAETRASSITDSILNLDDRYYNTWESITLNFKNIGSITFTKKDVRTNGFGKYFEVPINPF